MINIFKRVFYINDYLVLNIKQEHVIRMIIQFLTLTSILRVLQAIPSPLPVVYSIKIVQVLISNYLRLQSQFTKVQKTDNL
jgi:hypothetical protein